MENDVRKPYGHQLESISDEDAIVQKRLEWLLGENARNANKHRLYRSRQEQFEAVAMRQPLTHEKVFAYYGLMLGSLPPISIFFLFGLSKGAEPVALLLMAITTFVSSITGYSFGKVVGTMVRNNEDRRLAELSLRLIAIGALWGAIAGAAGGVFLFVIGAFFGAFIGGAVGAVALPAFAIPYLAVKSGDVMDLKHFLPLSLGVTVTICAFILSFG